MSILAATIQSVGGTATGGGGNFTFTDTIDSALASYDVSAAALAASPAWNGTSALIATITVAAGGEITGTADNAFDTGVLPAGSTVDLTVENTAFIRGNGGAGGDGKPIILPGEDGGDGGTAVNFQANGTITIDAGGEISGGGGGGGGGGGFLAGINDQGDGGGGGGGFPNGAGGDGPLSASDGAAGTAGGGGAGGAGGNGGGGGGNGGDAGAAGVSGTASTGAGGAAGAAGSAIEKNGFTVTVTENGTRNGAING